MNEADSPIDPAEQQAAQAAAQSAAPVAAEPAAPEVQPGDIQQPTQTNPMA